MRDQILKFSSTFLFLGILLTACNQPRAVKEMPTSLNAFIYAYTSGEISKAAPIKVIFTSSLISPEKVGTAVEDGVIAFRPRIKGTAVWEDDKTLRFTPEDYLSAKKEFVGVVDLEKLYKNLPGDAKAFEFGFRVKAQNFRVDFDGLRGVDPANTKDQQLSGTITTYDLAESEAVEQLLNVDFDGQNPKIRWEHYNNGKNHRFFVDGIQRKAEDSEMSVSWNGRALDVDKKDKRIFSVPGLNNFKLMSAEVVQDNEQYILLHFSDPVQQSQEFNGMVRISNYQGRLRFQVDGNQLRVYPGERLNGQRTVSIENGLKNVNNIRLALKFEETLLFEELEPEVRLVGDGVILPSSDGLIFPFEAVNLKAIDVEIFKIYDNNIMQFLQTNNLDGQNEYELNRVGKLELQKQVLLNDLGVTTNAATWTRYALDLSTMIEQDPKAIYQIRIGFRPEYTIFNCGTTPKDDLTVLEDPFKEEGMQASIMSYGYYGINGYYDGFEYEHREDPCFPAYYGNHRFVRRNVIASNLGIIAKQGADDQMQFFVTDLRTASPLANVDLQLFNYQQQMTNTLKTNSDGIAIVDLSELEEPFVAIANSGVDIGYLKLMDNNALSLSKFDVSGTVAQEGIKGFIYGERGVWRPGDSIYLNFVLEDKLDRLPDNHPLNFEFYDARNQLYQKFTTTTNVNNVYPLAIATKADDPTGNWRAKVQLGGATFTKTLKIETVKPNRLKINLDLGDELSAEDMPANTKLQVNWLHGAPARSLKTKVEMKLQQVNTSFKKFSEFEFDDPARKMDAEFKTIFEDVVSNEGSAQIKMDFRGNNYLPGKMRANFRTRAFESGGDFSEDNFSATYSPFKAYAGVSIPRNKYGSKRIDLENGGTVQFASVDEAGNARGNRKLKVGVYRAEWRWWWENSANNVSMYNSSTHHNALEQTTVTTDSKGLADWKLKMEDWGYYLVRVCDEESGHCSGDYFYSGYPWYDDDNSQHRKAAAMLVFSSDKPKYDVGEEVELMIPSSEGGRILVTIETGSQILDSYWINAQSEETKFRFETTPEMAPTVYAHVSHIQPHDQSENDLPIRMYGVIPISVEDPNTRLSPKVEMADVLKPEEKVTLKVSENDGKAMAYTVAVVDDGLLDLTRFKTPSPWNVFYAREALGVRTWDVYDHVLGASAGSIERLLSIGGDAAAVDRGGPEKANRFDPVVKHFGPFYLKRGETKTHEFVMPNYVGSVRTMIVASNNGAYGNAEKTTPVRKPLMVLATLPRVLGPGEKVKLPVNIFAMEDKVKRVNVKVEEVNRMVNFKGAQTQTLSFNQPGDQLATFEIEVPEVVGVAKFKVTAEGGGEVATQEIEIDVRNPNPYVTDLYEEVVENGMSWSKDFTLPGINGTNSAVLEVSNIPPLNLDKRLRYLIRYPHGCLEQTTSGAFPQLYVGNFTELSDKRKNQVARNINAAIAKMKKFQKGNGGFSYWPGRNYVYDWATTYAGHFLVEAKAKGYEVPSLMMDRWVEYQKSVARNWRPDNGDNYYSGNYALEQAYRLYTLALAGEAELGAMNRLREMPKLSVSTKWRLAAAYAVAGRKEVAEEIVNGLTTDIDPYTELSYTFGSATRDEAMILETMVILGRDRDAGILVKRISERINSSRWYSTQTLSYALKSIGQFISENKLSDELRFVYEANGSQEVSIGTQRPISLIELDLKGTGNKVSIRNTSGGLLYTKLVVKGQPIVGDQTTASNNMVMAVNYKTTDGKALDPSRIRQGTDFIAEITVRNNDSRRYYHREMALNQVFPSGWEILNTRMSNVANFENTDQPVYQDIRDDRVMTYYNTRYNKSKTFRIQLNAAYQGRFYLPSVTSEAMYDNTVNARQPGQWVEVVAQEGQGI